MNPVISLSFNRYRTEFAMSTRMSMLGKPGEPGVVESGGYPEQCRHIFNGILVKQTNRFQIKVILDLAMHLFDNPPHMVATHHLPDESLLCLALQIGKEGEPPARAPLLPGAHEPLHDPSQTAHSPTCVDTPLVSYQETFEKISRRGAKSQRKSEDVVKTVV
jgi:hypothetical protein